MIVKGLLDKAGRSILAIKGTRYLRTAFVMFSLYCEKLHMLGKKAQSLSYSL
jgi:hypothetical protein